MMTPPPPFPFHPGFAPMPPRPCPPPPPRHPDLWGDADGYTRKEIDEADARTLAAAKKYTDEKIAELRAELGLT